jgi:hypothetical protein
VTWKGLKPHSTKLVAAIILGIVIVLFTSAVPILDCPACDGWVETYLDDLHCNVCRNRRTVTILVRWKWQWSASH